MLGSQKTKREAFASLWVFTVSYSEYGLRATVSLVLIFAVERCQQSVGTGYVGCSVALDGFS